MEGLVPKLCQLAQELGDDDRALRLRAAGLQALSSMVLPSHIVLIDPLYVYFVQLCDINRGMSKLSVPLVSGD